MSKYDAVTIILAVFFNKVFEPSALFASKSSCCCIKSYKKVFSSRKSHLEPISGRSDLALEIIPSVEIDIMIAQYMKNLMVEIMPFRVKVDCLEIVWEIVPYVSTISQYNTKRRFTCGSAAT